jgi:hypothetical protein
MEILALLFVILSAIAASIAWRDASIHWLVTFAVSIITAASILGHIHNGKSDPIIYPLHTIPNTSTQYIILDDDWVRVFNNQVWLDTARVHMVCFENKRSLFYPSCEPQNK